jgi:hypothetical protein
VSCAAVGKPDGTETPAPRKKQQLHRTPHNRTPHHRANTMSGVSRRSLLKWQPPTPPITVIVRCNILGLGFRGVNPYSKEFSLRQIHKEAVPVKPFIYMTEMTEMGVFCKLGAFAVYSRLSLDGSSPRDGRCEMSTRLGAFRPEGGPI